MSGKFVWSAFAKLFAVASILLMAALPAKAFENYKPGLVQQALAKGETVFLDFSAVWCSTCKRQERVINSLLKQNPKFEQSIRFIKVDWDDYRGSEIARRYEVWRQSTLVMVRDDKVLGKIVAQTAEADIKALLNTGLAGL